MKRTLLRTGIVTAVLAAGALPAGAIAMATAFDHVSEAPAVLAAAREEPSTPAAPSTTAPEHSGTTVGSDHEPHSTTTTAPSTEKPPAVPPSAPTTTATAHVGEEPAGTDAKVGGEEGSHEGAPTPVLKAFRLGCSARPASAGLGVVCEWGTPDGGAASYQLLRFTKGEGDSIVPGSRVVLSSGTEHRFVDTTTEPGHVYRYSVITFDEANTLIAHTALATVAVGSTPPAPTTTKAPTTTEPKAPVRVSLRCSAPMVAGARRVNCEWGAGAGAASYVLRKGTNGAEPVTVAQVPAAGPRQAFDTDVTPGQVLVYSVIVLDGEGHQIGSATPVTLTVSPLEPTA